MIREKNTKTNLKRRVFGLFFVVLMIFSLLGGPWITCESAYAVPEGTDNSQNADDNQNSESRSTDQNQDINNRNAGTVNQNQETSTNEANNENSNTESNQESNKTTSKNGCKTALGPVAWLGCSGVGVFSKAVDWLYDKTEEIMVIDPITTEGVSPIYEIWKYFRGMTNIVFIIFLLVVIYSQVTGLGISNYGIKKTLPKLIVAAILVNLSFLVCSLAVDVSNLLGNSLRGLFTSVEEKVAVEMATDAEYIKNMGIATADMYNALAGITAAGIIGIALAPQDTWMLILVVAGGLVAVIAGLVTISLRQAVVALLIMISPLAVVAYMLPNTDKWFKKWRDLFARMLVFYPLFSLLFGASALAGFALIASAKDGFGILLGTAVRIFPLFFSWKLMKMSGTPLSAVNAGIHRLSARPLGRVGRWTESHRRSTKHRLRTAEQPIMPTTRLNQYLFKRRFSRDAETMEYIELEKNMGFDFHAKRRYDADGSPSKRGIEAYSRQARNMKHYKMIEQDKNNMNEGLGLLAATQASTDEKKKAIIEKLDLENMNASDYWKAELERGAVIDYRNTEGRWLRMVDAKNAKADLDAWNAGNSKHEFHRSNQGSNYVLEDGGVSLSRYNKMKEIMQGKDEDVERIIAGAANQFDAQAQISQKKFVSHNKLIVPTQDIVNTLDDLLKSGKADENIDRFLGGMEVLNMRGDTDLAGKALRDFANNRKQLRVGKYSTQAVNNHNMFTVKDNDPFDRRFGKYSNLQTAAMFNEDDPSERRTKPYIDYDEYVNGEYVDRDRNGDVIPNEDGTLKIRYPKKSAVDIIKGTSWKGMERTALANMDNGIRDSSIDIVEEALSGNRVFDYERFVKNSTNIWDACLTSMVGDHFSFASQSEQMVAMCKGITGIDSAKHRINWKGIFGDGSDDYTRNIVETITPRQKIEWLTKSLHGRVTTFNGKFVSNQLARYKTDMLDAMKEFYAYELYIKDKLGLGPDKSLESLSDADIEAAIAGDETLGNLLDFNFKGFKEDEYKGLLDANFEGVKEEFRKGFKPEALDRFRLSYGRGYQGDTKPALAEMVLSSDDFARSGRNNQSNNSNRNNQRNQNRNNNRRRTEPDNQGVPQGTDDAGANDFSEYEYNNTTEAIKRIYEEYRGRTSGDENVQSFWSRVKNYVTSSPEVSNGDVIVNEIESGMDQHTDVVTLYNKVINKLTHGSGE